MKFVVFDTETTGLFDFKQPADADGQPRLASFAAIHLDDIDAEPRRTKRYIRPDGWSVAEFDAIARAQGKKPASEVNGLSDEFLQANGVPVAEVLDLYAQAIEDGYIVVAFNAQFDTKVMRAELRRAKRDDMFERTPNICVMRPLTNILKLPKKSGPAWGYKFVSLAEACAHCGVVNENPHDAMADADGALGVMRWLHTNGLLPEPAVHYAKARE